MGEEWTRIEQGVGGVGEEFVKWARCGRGVGVGDRSGRGVGEEWGKGSLVLALAISDCRVGAPLGEQ